MHFSIQSPRTKIARNTGYFLLVCSFWAGLLLPETSFASFNTNLEYGARGPAVVELQKILIERGYLSGTPTGNFLSLTKKAVVAYQKSLGLPATGYVGPLTRAKLNASGSVGNAPTFSTSTSETLPKPSTSSIAQIPFYIAQNIWDFSSSTGFFNRTTKAPPTINFIDGSTLPTRTINPQSIVLVRCQYVPKYIRDVAGGDTSPLVLSGTGVVISSQGHILTAGHVLRVDELVREDTERIWTRTSCEVAPTDAKLTPIDALGQIDPARPSRFIPATIAFEPNDTQYNPSKSPDPGNPNHTIYFGGGADLDFALLKVENANLPHTPVLSKLLNIKPGEKLIGLGYPTLETTSSLELERIDTQFNGYLWAEDSSCITKITVEECGIRYQGKRYKLDYKKLYGIQTPLGKHTSYFRGGFSGGPLFYNGYVAGIMIVGRENPYSGLYDLGTVGQWNWVEALSTSEIVPTLQKAGIKIEGVI